MFPWYLSVGMPADQFWDGDPWLAAGYREADRLRSQRKSEEMWLQGLYIYNAVSVVVGNALSKKGRKPQKYPLEPIRVTPLSSREKAEMQEAERKKAVAYFDRMMERQRKNEK